MEVSNFKRGDRVSVVGGICNTEEDECLETDIYKVSRVREDGAVILTDEDGERLVGMAHPRQCRRLVKRERRRVWVRWAENELSIDDVSGPKFLDGVPVEFVEVKAKRGKG